MSITNPPKPVAAAIFDFDETVIDLEHQHHAAYEFLCRAQGSDYFAIPAEVRNASGRRVLDEVNEMREFFGWTVPMDELMSIRQRAFDDFCARDELALLPGAEEVIRSLHRTRIPLAITSSSVASSIDAILTRFGLRPLFTVIVDGAQVTRAKPDPEGYLLTARLLGGEPARCVVFEDSAIGVRAAKRAGMYCIAVRNPRAGIHQDLSEADAVLRSFEELAAEELESWRRG
jgi:HAD superfamily hydrolase (TIGR01509 family)